MLCAFEGPPRIVRLHGTRRGRACRRPALRRAARALRLRRSPRCPRRAARSSSWTSTRIADSCGYGVPLMGYEGERPHHGRVGGEARARPAAPEAFGDYQREKNAASIDGLPALDSSDGDSAAVTSDCCRLRSSRLRRCGSRTGRTPAGTIRSTRARRSTPSLHLRIHEFLDARPIMGPLSLLLRAPFAALGQLVGHGGRPHDYLDDYRFGVFPCLMAAGLFGIVSAGDNTWTGRPHKVLCARSSCFGHQPGRAPRRSISATPRRSSARPAGGLGGGGPACAVACRSAAGPGSSRTSSGRSSAFPPSC